MRRSMGSTLDKAASVWLVLQTVAKLSVVSLTLLKLSMCRTSHQQAGTGSSDAWGPMYASNKASHLMILYRCLVL